MLMLPPRGKKLKIATKEGLQPKVKVETTKMVPTRASEEQLIYSGILNLGRKIGLSVTIVAFLLYVAGIVKPKVPFEDLPRYWGLSSSEFVKAAGLKPGWAWVGMYGYGDMLTYFGIAILALVSVICYLAIIPSLLRKKDFIFASIALLEVIVLVLAASGIINTGG
ncbi:MAG: hypothetical protein Q8J63_06405 [Candidatus Aquicultor sp.]|nr:hypothetical protein [Candidatus Aquicultor sp.]